MSIGAIQFIPAQAMPESATPLTATQAPGKDFAAWMNQEMHNLNQVMHDADTGLRGLAVGEAVNLHEVMMTLEKAKLTFQLALSVRNKLLEGYQELMRMQL